MQEIIHLVRTWSPSIPNLILQSKIHKDITHNNMAHVIFYSAFRKCFTKFVGRIFEDLVEKATTMKCY